MDKILTERQRSQANLSSNPSTDTFQREDDMSSSFNNMSSVPAEMHAATMEKKRELIEIRATIDAKQQAREQEKLKQLANLRKRQAEEAKNPKPKVEEQVKPVIEESKEKKEQPVKKKDIF